MKSKIMVEMLLIIMFLAAIFLKAQAKIYHFKNVDYPGAHRTIVTGINNKNEVVCVYYGGDGGQGFLYNGDQFIRINVPGVSFCDRFDINDNGTIVMCCNDSSFAWVSYIYDGTNFSRIDFPGATYTDVYEINNDGVVVGSYYLNGGHGFIFKNGQYKTVDYPGAVNSGLTAISDNGIMVGTFWDGNVTHSDDGFEFDGTDFIHIDLNPSTWRDAELNGINDNGEIAGLYEGPQKTHSFIYHGGKFESIKSPNASRILVHGINNTGVICGVYTNMDGISHGFIGFPTFDTDFDSDFDVDGNDLALLAKSFGSAEAQVEYNSLTDVNDDGNINIDDLAAFVISFGN